MKYNARMSKDRIPLRENITGQSLILTVLAIMALGTITVHSALASVKQSTGGLSLELRHVVFAVLAMIVLALASRMDYRWLARGRRLPWPAVILLALAVVLGALVFVPGLGHSAGGKTRWIRLGPDGYSMGLQPSELIKFAMIIFLAAWLTRPQTNVRSFKTFVLCMAVLGVSEVFVIKEDLGTGVLIALSALVVMFLAGVPWYYLGSTIILGGVAGYFFVVMEPYRLARITAMMDPWSNDNISSYQVKQSLLTILSGGWNGVGLGNGTMKMGFLPEDHTDFIFASFCEEWGFRGAVILVGLFGLWMLHCRKAARRAVDSFGHLLAGALGISIILQAGLHIAVNMVLLPPTGIALPFFSAGGTGLVVMAAASSLIVSVSSRRVDDAMSEDFAVPSLRIPVSKAAAKSEPCEDAA